MAKKVVMIASEIDVNQINYSEVRTLDNGGRISYINYGDGIDSISLQTPQFTFPFDTKFYPDDKGGGKFSCVVSVKSNNKDEKEFLDKLTEIDNKIIDDAKKNSQNWFKKKSIL